MAYPFGPAISADEFFEKLRAQGVEIRFDTIEINGETSEIINLLRKRKSQKVLSATVHLDKGENSVHLNIIRSVCARLKIHPANVRADMTLG